MVALPKTCQIPLSLRNCLSHAARAVRLSFRNAVCLSGLAKGMWLHPAGAVHRRVPCVRCVRLSGVLARRAEPERTPSQGGGG